MHIISWNIRGANSPKKQKAIRNMRLNKQMDMLFLQETKINSHNEKTTEALWGRE
ncbi:unnamed protein product [Rhodiola kirilowii]